MTTNNQQDDKMREFEAWARDRGLNLEKDEDGDYSFVPSCGVNDVFRAWNAAIASREQPAQKQDVVERVMRTAKEFVDSLDIHEPIGDSGMTVADAYKEAFRHAFATAAVKEKA